MLVSLLVGAAFCVFIPFNAGFDEETHLARIYEISGSNFFMKADVPSGGTYIPLEFFSLSYQRRYFLTPAQNLLRAPRFNKTIDQKDLFPYQTRSIYPPEIFFPQALVARVGWRMLHQPVIPVSILMRLAGLLVYVTGAFLAIRILPFGKWVMLVLALSPMALFQAATLNADGFNNAVSFLFIALLISVTIKPAKAIQWREILALTALCLAIGLSKPGAVAILPALWILPWRTAGSRKKVAVVIAGALLAIALTAAWSLIAVPQSHFASDGEQSLSQQVKLALANPLDFLQVFVSGVWNSLPRYYLEWVGVYGHWLGSVPAAIYGLYPLAVLGAVLAEPGVKQFSGRARAGTIAAFLAALLATCVFFYVLYYSPGSTSIGGVQGRYLTPFGPLLFLPLAGWLALPQRLARASRPLALGLLALVIGLYSIGLAATYYTYCGKSYYTGEACTQPVYKNLDKAGAPEIEINADTSLRQTFTPVCEPLDGVDVFIKAVRPGAAGLLRMAVLDDTGKAIASGEYAPNTIEPGKYLALPVLGRPQADGKTFTLQVDSPNLAAKQGVILGTSTQKEYSGGALSLLNQPQPVDLIFHYRCANPWSVLLNR